MAKKGAVSYNSSFRCKMCRPSLLTATILLIVVLPSIVAGVRAPVRDAIQCSDRQLCFYGNSFSGSDANGNNCTAASLPCQSITAVAAAVNKLCSDKTAATECVVFLTGTFNHTRETRCCPPEEIPLFMTPNAVHLLSPDAGKNNFSSPFNSRSFLSSILLGWTYKSVCSVFHVFPCEEVFLYSDL